MNSSKLSNARGKVPKDCILTHPRIGGKGTPRRKVKKVTKQTAQDDKKLSTTLKKLNVQPVAGIDQVNMFMANGKVIHFINPKVQASVQANTFVISGAHAEKDLVDLVPDILTQLGPDALNSLKKLAEGFQQQTDQDIPELVENFDENNE